MRIKNLLRSVLMLLLVVGTLPAMAAFKDIKIDLNSLLTSEETVQGTALSFGLAVADDGTVSRVAADEPTANAVVSGTYHSDHGWTGSQMVVAVDGPVKIGIGNCTYSGTSKAKATATDGTVVDITTEQTCYKNDQSVSYGYYNGEATTLTIKGSDYNRYFSVEAVNMDDIPNEATLTYTLGEATAEGTVPAAVKVAIGGVVKIPANTTLYAEGKTLTGWTDGAATYTKGQEVTLTEDITLTPIFTDNSVSLSDRTETVAIKWYFGEGNGVGTLNAQGKTTLLVAQAVVGEHTIDVKMAIDATNGKANNVGRGDSWAQVNSGTILTVPSCKDAEVSMTAYGTIGAEGKTATTFAGQANYTAGTTVTYTAVDEAATLDIVVGNDASYVSEVSVSLPVVEQKEDNEPIAAAWRDIKIDFTNGQMLTSEETELTTFGVAIAEDGAATRVAADDATANIVVTGKFHSNEHGLGNFSATVKVEGPVKVSMGTCAWGGDVVIKNEAGETVGTFNTNNGACYHNDKAANIAYGYYNGEATTLTISDGSYTPYVAVEKLEEVIAEATVTYALGEVVAEGEVPAAVKVVVGEKVVVPANFTLYVEGKTLTGWTDGTNTYAAGDEIAPEADVTLTPVFTDNEVTLADRKAPVTLKWDFQRQNGAPTVGYEGKTAIWITQAIVEGKTIDVKMDVDATDGKMANGNWNDWAQLNGGTKFTIPSCKDAVVSMEAYSAITTTTIDGQTDYTSGNTISYTIANTAETIEIVIGDGSYYRYIQTVLPVVEKDHSGASFDNVEGTISWKVGDETSGTLSAGLEGAISNATVGVGDGLTVKTATYFESTMVHYTPLTSDAGTVEGVMVEYRVKPAAGVTFKPLAISYDCVKVGTDGATYSWSYTTGGVESTITKVDAATTLRNNGANSATAELNHTINIEAEASDVFTFRFYISHTANNKNICIGNVVITGIVNGTVADIAKYTLAAAANIPEAGTVNVYPASEVYDDGTELTLTATENFGYDFVNWTNAAGEEVSTENKFVWTVTADEVLTANFKQVNTYELAMTIDGGANDYMISYNPTPTIVDGKQMYEEGTIVGIAAASNPILTFTNWDNGETNPTLSVTMDADKAYTASYSAVDYIVGWDFIKRGNNGRPADFASTTDNETATLYLINENGDTQGWLDKSKEAAGGYESFEGAAVNWKKLGEYWYETKINATEFTEIRVEAELMYNYNAYTTVIVEYSVDGTEWAEGGRVTMAGAKTENAVSAEFGDDANNQATLYIRFRPDKEFGSVDGTSAPDNDGTTITNIFVYGTKKLVDDGKDPTLLSSVPDNGATGASATGKIVLNFHEKVTLANAKATIGDKEVEGVVSGKTVTFPYMGLQYNTEYTFTLAANSVYDLTGNACKEDIVIKFTTIAPPTVTPGMYDAVVTNADELLDAFKKADGQKRFRIFLHDGTYDLGNACLTTVPGNVSLIGESMENTIIMNKAIEEGIGITATLCTGGENVYMQDLTIKNAGDYDATAFAGRYVALQENASKAIYKNVRLLSNQDTYYTRATKRTYWEGGMITGTVDYICGGGDVFFNGVTLYNNARSNGNCITAPATSSDWGYVFVDCTIDGDKGQDGIYSLGRPWQSSPRAVYINTTMKIIPTAAGWSDMGAVPALFAEYNSHTESGAPVDCSKRKTSFKSNDVDVAVTYNPVLTAAEAAKFTVENVLAGDDGWQPQLLTEQAIAPVLTVADGLISWPASDYVFCYAICKNGKVVEFTNETSYTIPTDAADTDLFSVRAANEMGGLGVASAAVNNTGIQTLVAGGEVVSTTIYNASGVAMPTMQRGLNIVCTTYANGAVRIEKVVK